MPGGGRLDYMRVCYRGCEPLCMWRGVAYIECARTPAILHYKGLNVHKVGALLITLALSVVNDLKDYGGTPARYNVE